MNQIEKIEFLSKKTKELTEITSQLEDVFPEKSFELDGILVGNIVELMLSSIYGITLYRQSEKMHDGEISGIKVQIKGTQKFDSIVIREEPEHLLVAYLDKREGVVKEIYNGPGSIAWQYRKYVPSMNFYTIRVRKLIELNESIPHEQKLSSRYPIEIIKFNQASSENIVKCEKKKGSSSKGKTLVTGYINRKDQENLGCLNKPGTHSNQVLYQLRCRKCGFKYEANGCDIGIRKCPKCMLT